MSKKKKSKKHLTTKILLAIATIDLVKTIVELVVSLIKAAD